MKINIPKRLKSNKYIIYIKTKIYQFKYNLNNYETPEHDFIFLKIKSTKWENDGFEKVGKDWHIRILRKSDNKVFLFDQPFYYYLQIYNNQESELRNELFITYGVNQETIEKMKYTIKKLNL